MVKIVKNTRFLLFFGFLLTLLCVFSCSPSKNNIFEVKASKTNINSNIVPASEIDAFISPYRNYVNQNLDSILAFNAIAQDKSKGRWQTNIGNLFAQTTFTYAKPIFEYRENKKLNGCILNHGGIRSVIPKGNVTTRTAYEIMPFENSIVVVGLTGNEITTLANYIISEQKPHPLFGITIYTKKKEDKLIRVVLYSEHVIPNKTYYIATSDYLANGGDNMLFLKNSTIKYDLDYKLRNLFIDYFKEVDSLPNITTQHVITAP